MNLIDAWKIKERKVPFAVWMAGEYYREITYASPDGKIFVGKTEEGEFHPYTPGLQVEISRGTPLSDEDKKKMAIVEYCLVHIEFMWSARILSFLFDCDYRDAEKIAVTWKDANKVD